MENLEKDYLKNCGKLQDYIFQTIEFFKKNKIQFESNVLEIINEEIIKIELEYTDNNYFYLIQLNEDINEYIEDCSSESFYEDLDNLEDFIEIVV